MDVKIHAVRFRADKKLLDLVLEKSTRLTLANDRIESVDVYLKIENNHQNVKEKVVEIKMSLPGHRIFVMHKAPSFEEAFRRTLDSAVESLRRRKE